MATKLKSADIVIVGLGWTGGILAKELADTGLSIVVLERGAPRDTNPDFMYPIIHDELRYAQRHQLMQDVSRETVTFRNNANETALPMRQLGSFLPGEGVGGAGVHWNGVTWRWLPWDHEPLKLTLGSYGRSVIPPDMQLQDWGVSWRSCVITTMHWPSTTRAASWPIARTTSISIRPIAIVTADRCCA